MDQSSPSNSPATRNAYGLKRQFGEKEYCGGRQDKPGHDDMFLSLPAGLSHEKRKSEVSVPNVFDVVQPGDKGIWHDKRLHKRSLGHVHCCYFPAQRMSLQGAVKSGNSAPANHENNTAGYVIAEYTGSISAFRQNTPQICNQLASLFNRKYYPADDTAFFLHVNHADYSDGAQS